MKGPDHKISLEPYELKRLVRDIRVADQAMGKQQRFLLRGEILNRELFGKSLMAACDIRKGTTIKKEMIIVQGPGKGLPPGKMGELIGKCMNRNIRKDDFFLLEDLEGPHNLVAQNSFRSRWGLISRFSDLSSIDAYKPKVIEFHMAEKDFDLGFKPNGHQIQELVIHAPEYIGDKILDLCSGSEAVRSASVDSVQRTIHLAQSMAPHFKGIPKVIVHPGAMSLNAKLNKKTLEQTLMRSVQEIDHQKVELLFENLPPYPWYFGGQWKGNYFMDAYEISSFCEETGINICFDLSHAALYCNAKERNLHEWISIVKPFIRHIHFSDAYGLDGEGVQIGHGDIDFGNVMPLFSDYCGTWVPEIWRGHLNNGKGFLEALSKLRQYNL
jgi:N-acetylneuraminate synthase